jgi:Zn-dependent peptidase ImmA (M78 family)/transcriptional regulator with XRE-family HTH domain
MIATTGLGARLRLARERAGFSQQEVADALGVARELLSYWENEHRTPGLAHLARLGEAYGLTTGSLLGTEPEPALTEEHDLVYRSLRAQKPHTRIAVRRWLAFLDDWAALLEACAVELPGRALPPDRAWRAARPITDTRLAQGLAAQVRAFYGLGTDAIPDLLAFLDRQGVLVYRVALDPIGDGEGVSGVFYNHPRLGYSILVNTATTPGRQTFTLAHEFAHALFHYQERGLVSRTNDPDRTERFADAFAAHFLVPGAALREWVARSPWGEVLSPLDVLDLHRYFRVSYATMLIRLRSEGLLSPERYEEYRAYSPSRLAARLGLECDDYYPSASIPGTSLACYPTSVLERVRALIDAGDLSPAGAADLLQVAQEEILDELLAPPEPAQESERREFDELPGPATRRTPAKERAAR